MAYNICKLASYQLALLQIGILVDESGRSLFAENDRYMIIIDKSSITLEVKYAKI